jgi:hypothetical protein
MKKLLTLLLILTSLTTFAQLDPETGLDAGGKRPMWLKYHTAGDEFKKMGNHFYIGAALAVGGGITTGLVSGFLDNPLKQPGFYIGIATATAGSILMLEAPLHGWRAGVILNASGVTLRAKF